MILIDISPDEGIAEDVRRRRDLPCLCRCRRTGRGGIVIPPIVWVVDVFWVAMAPMLESITTIITTMLSFQNGFMLG
jgi:hypothetical protein